MSNHTFASACLTGTYAVMITGDGGCLPYAAIGLLTFDGAGLVTGHFTESQAGPSFSERTIVNSLYRGRYCMYASGLGHLLHESSEEIDGYLVMREVVDRPGGPIAQEIALIFRALDSASGSLRTGVGWRRPEAVKFSNASLNGHYTGFAIGRGGQVPVAGFGVLSYDGAGGFSEENVANVQGETIAARQFVNGTDQGRYTVDVDGTGTVAGGGVLLVITRATIVDGVARSDEYSFMARSIVPTNGAYFTGVVRRISD
ncbi:MAG: hypothetical protein WAN46_12830 [Gammaproteobacteria bacterium]